MPRTSEVDGHRHNVTAEGTNTSVNDDHSHSVPTADAGSTGDTDDHSHAYNRGEDVRKDEGEMVFRTFAVRASHIDEEDRTFKLSFSSEEPVERFTARDGEFLEVLGHADGEIDLEFIGSGRAPLLLDHDPLKQIGVVSQVQVGDGRAQAFVKVSRSDSGTEILHDVVDGIRGNVSVGYFIREQEVQSTREGDPKVIRAINWTPIEVSLVSIPADTTVGVGRNKTVIKSQGDNTMTDKIETPKVEIDIEAVTREATAKEQTRNREINALGNKFDMTHEAEQFIKDGRSAAEMQTYVLENMKQETAVTQVEASRSEEIGLTEKEVQNFSFQRAINALANPTNKRFQEEAAFEIECSQAAEKLSGRQATGIMVPNDVLSRELTAGAAGTDTGAFVAEDLLSGSFIDLLRNNTTVVGMGATMLTGLQGNVAIPRQNSAVAAAWVDPESTALTPADQGTDQVTLTPKTVGAATDFSRQLLMQSSVDIESFIRNDLAAQIAIAIDLAALYGSGAAGQPTGIITAGPAKDVFAGPVPTFGEIVDLESTVAAANALAGSLSYLTDFADRGSLKTTAVDAGSGIFVHANNQMNGQSAVASNQVVSGDVIFGNWADLLIGMWGGLDIQVDQNTLALKGAVRVVALQSVDVAIRHIESFAYGNDTP